MNPVTHIVQFLIWLINSIMKGESFGTIAWQAVSRIPSLISSLMQFNGNTTADQVDTVLHAADGFLGSDPDAIDLLKTLPPDMEEKLTDAALTMTEILIKNSLKLPGYHEEPKT